jgi:hypothetical protein
MEDDAYKKNLIKYYAMVLDNVLTAYRRILNFTNIIEAI